MKVLMLTDKMDIGGAETHVLELISALKKEGCEVTLLCGGGCYAERLKAMGVTVTEAPLYLRGAVAIARSYRILKRALSESAPDLIHAHTRYTAALAHAAAPRTPLCVTAHLPFRVRAYQRPLTRWGDATLAVSPDIEEYLVREYGIPTSRIFPTKNGIDTTTFSQIPHTEEAIVHISRLDKDRSLAARVLLSIAEKLLWAHPNYTLRIVGDGEDFPLIEKEARAVNRALGREGVILTGAVSNVGEELARGSIFVGVSRALLEALSQGLPSILAGNEGYGGIVCEENFQGLAYSNFCGRECESLCADTLLEDLERLIASAPLREELSAFGARAVRGEYSTEKMAKDALRAYRHATGACVFLIGYYGFGNLGDELTLRALTDMLEKKAVKEISVLSARRGGVGEIRHISRKNPLAILGAIRHADTVILGGGNLLQNETSNRSLYYYGTLIRLARRYRKRLLMIGAGLGPVTGERQIKYTRALLSSFDDIFLRTEWDIRYAKEVFGYKNAKYQPDLVLHFPPFVAKKSHTVNIFLHGGKKNEGRELLLRFLKKRGYEVRYIILFTKEDLTCAKEYATRYPGKIYIPKDFREAREAIASSLFSVSERLHGGILSLLSACAVIF